MKTILYTCAHGYPQDFLLGEATFVGLGTNEGAKAINFKRFNIFLKISRFIILAI